MRNCKIAAVLMAMILAVSSGFSVYGEEVYGMEPVETEENELAGGVEEEPDKAAEAEPEETMDVIEEEPAETICAVDEVPSDADDEEEAAEPETSEAGEEDAEPEPSDVVEEDTEEAEPSDVVEEAETVEEKSPDTFEEGTEYPVFLVDEAEEQSYTPKDEKSSDELFAGYVDSEFGITDTEAGQPGLFQKKRATAGSRLKSDTLAAYRYISSQLPLIASGEITSTHFTVPDEDVTFTQIAWTAEELGVPAIAENNAITQEAKDAASAKLKEEYFNLSILLDALLADHPYLLYWYDKTTITTADGYNFRAFNENGVWYLGFRGSITLNFPVADEYAAGEYVVDASVGQSVQTAVDNALAIVSECDALPDYEKLAAYREKICDSTSYNYEATWEGVPYGNPWQLIWVFDGDPGTRVVCEGYAKAFKYLCDRSSFEEDIDCRSVTGRVNGSGHMWNIVTMGEELNYLTDVTNCDKGTVGEDIELFLVGASGSPQYGYTVDLGGIDSMYYTYDQDMLALWPVEELTLSQYSYDPLQNAVVDGIEDKIYTGDEIMQEITVWSSGLILSEGTDYTLFYDDNTDAGTAKVIIEGAGNYRGTIEREFEILKAAQPLSASLGKIVYGRTTEAEIIGAKGGLTAEISDPAIAQITYVDGAGMLTIKGTGIGTAVLTLTAAETENYDETVLETEIRVVPCASTHVGLTNVASGIKIYWNEVAGAKYYKVYRGEKYLFTTSRLYATDTGVAADNGKKYTYRVFASTTKEIDTGDSTICRTGTGYRLVPVGIDTLKNTSEGRMTVTYGKNAKSTGYVIRYGLKQDMSDANVITVQGAGTLSRVIGGVKKGKTYYVQIRTYRLENNVRYYSGYSKTKSVKIVK